MKIKLSLLNLCLSENNRDMLKKEFMCVFLLRTRTHIMALKRIAVASLFSSFFSDLKRDLKEIVKLIVKKININCSKL